MDILNIKKPIIVDNVLHINDNMNILEYIFTNGKFTIGINNPRPKARLKKALYDEVQHAGFSIISKSEKDIINPFDDPLNLYAFVIANQISKNLNFKYKQMERVNYNYYCREQCATSHTDCEHDNRISILYNFHSTDGGTEILGEQYQDIAGQAKVFKSSWLHNSWPTVKDKGRVNLNIKLII
jgi:hypothetical protein